MGDFNQIGIPQMDGQLLLLERESHIEAAVVPGDFCVNLAVIQPSGLISQEAVVVFGLIYLQIVGQVKIAPVHQAEDGFEIHDTCGQ